MLDEYLEDKIDEIVESPTFAKKFILGLIQKYNIDSETIDKMIWNGKRYSFYDQFFTNAIKEEKADLAKYIIENQAENSKYIIEINENGEYDYDALDRVIKNICGNINNSPDLVEYIIKLFLDDRLMYCDDIFNVCEKKEFVMNYNDYFCFSLYNGAVENAIRIFQVFNVSSEVILMNQCIYGDSYIADAKLVWDIIWDNQDNISEERRGLRHFHPKELINVNGCGEIMQWYNTVSPFSWEELQECLIFVKNNFPKEKKLSSFLKKLA